MLTHVEIGRHYKAVRTVGLVDLKPLGFSANEVTARLRKIQPVAEVEIEKQDVSVQPPAKAGIAQLVTVLGTSGTPAQWATAATPALTAFRKALATASVSLPDREEGRLSEIEEIASQIAKDGPAWQAARNWVRFDNVSIHATRAGGDEGRDILHHLASRFNPRHPRGWRRHTAKPLLCVAVSLTYLRTGVWAMVSRHSETARGSDRLGECAS